MLSTLIPLSVLAIPSLAQYTATYTPGHLPDTSQQGQSGTNNCGTTDSQTSECQNVYINSVEDFCLWGPPSTHSDEGDGTAKIGNVEQVVVSYCLQDGYGTRLMPPGTITAAHFVKVVNEKVSYVQVTGTGNFTNILIPAGDDGGELDPHSWTGLGNPQGGLVFTNAYNGTYEEAHEWTSFISAYDFCFRACQDGPNAPGYCQHIYDTLSCGFTIPGSMDPGFDECEGDPTDEEPGVYNGSTFSQGDPSTPAPHPPGATSMCTPYTTVGASSTGVNNAVNPSGSTSASGSMSTSGSISGSMSSSSSSSGSSSTITMAPSTSSTSANRSSSASSSSASASSKAIGGAERRHSSNLLPLAGGGAAALLAWLA